MDPMLEQAFQAAASCGHSDGARKVELRTRSCNSSVRSVLSASVRSGEKSEEITLRYPVVPVAEASSVDSSESWGFS
jgi:hypothetical protein